MIQKIMKWIHESTRKEEEYSERDGAFSYAGEYHALIIGLGMGVYSGITGDIGAMATLIGVALGVSGVGKLPQFAENVVGEVRKEPWYTVGGVLGSYIVVKMALEGVDAVGGVL